MAQSIFHSLTTVFCVVISLLYFSHANLITTDKEEPLGSTELRKPSSSETNIFNFVRLFFLRMVYGFANMIGVGDFLEDFAGGIFAPPSPEYDGLSYDGGNDDEYKEYDDYGY